MPILSKIYISFRDKWLQFGKVKLVDILKSRYSQTKVNPLMSKPAETGQTWYFTLSNARRFYSSMGNPWESMS